MLEPIRRISGAPLRAGVECAVLLRELWERNYDGSTAQPSLRCGCSRRSLLKELQPSVFANSDVFMWSETFHNEVETFILTVTPQLLLQ